MFLSPKVSINAGSSERTVSEKKINTGEIAKFKGIEVLQMLPSFFLPVKSMPSAFDSIKILSDLRKHSFHVMSH